MLALAMVLSFATDWPATNLDLPKAGGGDKDVAVVVGITRYAFLPPIAGAADNARDWAAYFVRVRGVPLDRVHLVPEDEATKEGLEEVLAQAASETKQGGTAWLVFVGHGAPSTLTGDGLLLGVDAQPKTKSVEARGLPQRRALDLLSVGKQAHTLAIFDACFSGTAPDGKTPLVPGAQATIPVRHLTAPAKAVVLSSSEQVAGPLPKHDRPAFSYLMLGGLRGWADADHDGLVAVDEAFAYTSEVLKIAVTDRNQKPSLRGDASGIRASGAWEKGPDLASVLVGERNTVRGIPGWLTSVPHEHGYAYAIGVSSRACKVKDAVEQADTHAWSLLSLVRGEFTSLRKDYVATTTLDAGAAEEESVKSLTAKLHADRVLAKSSVEIVDRARVGPLVVTLARVEIRAAKWREGTVLAKGYQQTTEQGGAISKEATTSLATKVVGGTMFRELTQVNDRAKEITGSWKMRSPSVSADRSAAELFYAADDTKSRLDDGSRAPIEGAGWSKCGLSDDDGLAVLRRSGGTAFVCEGEIMKGPKRFTGCGRARLATSVPARSLGDALTGATIAAFANVASEFESFAAMQAGEHSEDAAAAASLSTEVQPIAKYFSKTKLNGAAVKAIGIHPVEGGLEIEALVELNVDDAPGLAADVELITGVDAKFKSEPRSLP